MVKTMTDNIICHRCNREISENEVLISQGQALCEDCYIDSNHKIKVCNPLGERAKKVFRKNHGLEGINGLSHLQKEIYQYIQLKGKVTAIDLIEQFNLSPTELENHFAIMRHSQLVKGKKDGGDVYIILWSD